MSEDNILFKPIGVIHSEHTVSEKTPAQPVFASECTGYVGVYPDYAEGLRNIEGFSHLYLIYQMHRVEQARLIVKPFLHHAEHGIFATRAPYRPNAIGLSIVELIGREQNILHIKGVDILDGTPLLDIKPYSTKFDHIVATRSGWLDEVDDETAYLRGRRQYDAK